MLLASVITPHTPRMAIEDKAPDFVSGLIAGSKELGVYLRNELKPDLFVMTSTHWVSSFNWYVTSHEIHEGRCVADEAPDLISGLPYRYAGEPRFARALIEAVADRQIPCFANDTPYFNWDYGHYVPLRYIDPEGEVPVVLMPTCLAADFDECRRVGRIVCQTADALERRVVFICSTALSHKILRGPEQWPTKERQRLDFEFLEMLEAGKVPEAIDRLPGYCRETVAEMGGRPLAMLLGTMQTMEHRAISGRRFGPYAQSSGSGNISVCFTSGAASQ